jgi:hypothetical protein
MKNYKIKAALILVAIPTLYALLVRWLFGVNTWRDLYSVMTVTFLFCLPTIVGALTIYFSPFEKVKNYSYRIFVPWIPIFLFLIITLALSIEGWACWIMVLPLFLIAASVGGLIGAWFKLRKKDGNVYVSVLTLLPFLLAPAESLLKIIPGTYEAYTCIDIYAPGEKIWSNVTRVRTIKETQDKGWLTKRLGFPRPVKAELNYEGVGAYREAIFTNGLVFHETVSVYTGKQKMVFSIRANPYEIPSTTMDEHVVIGGKYFDVLNGTYELQRINDSTYRLHLYSHFKLSTSFNFYASWWARWIMQDIQNNILQVEKQRAENE